MVSAVIVIVAMWVNVNVKLGLKYKWLKYVTSTTAALCVLLVGKANALLLNLNLHIT